MPDPMQKYPKELFENGGLCRPTPSPNSRSHADVYLDQFRKRIVTEPEVTLKDLKESIDKLVTYLKPYSGNLIIGKSAVDEYEKLLKGEHHDPCKK